MIAMDREGIFHADNLAEPSKGRSESGTEYD
jgi:hypothetical protein